MLALALTYWPFFSPHRLCRDAARAQHRCSSTRCEGIGASRRRILFLHILPNVASPVIVRATIGMGFTILIAAVLGFLGIGATPPDPDWGLAISESRDYLPDAWWFVDLPGPRHPHHRARLQPAGRRPARPRRSAAEAVAMSDAALLEVAATCACRSRDRRGPGADPRPRRADACARAHPRRRRRVGLRQVDPGSRPSSASCPRQPRSTSGEHPARGRGPRSACSDARA